MKKVIICAALVLLSLLPAACTSNPTVEQDDTYDTYDPIVEQNDTYDYIAIDVPAYYQAAAEILTKIPFDPIPGNVVMLSHSWRETLIFTDCSIWKIPDAMYRFSKPVRAMDTIDNIEQSMENRNVMTTDNTLYFLDFENGEPVRQLENVTSLYFFHYGTGWNPLRYARTADGTAWRVDTAQPVRLPDDHMVICGRPGEDRILDIVSADQWFDNDVRDAWGLFVLTEDNVLWEFDSWTYDAVPAKIMEDVKAFDGWFIITTDNVLRRFPPWDNPEAGFSKVMENVKSVANGLIITTDNELWGYRPWAGGEPFKIAKSVKSVQGSFGFITLDDTLWWLPDWRSARWDYQEPVRVKENVLHTWWNWIGPEYIITTDGSLWLFNYEDSYLVQIFQAVH